MGSNACRSTVRSVSILTTAGATRRTDFALFMVHALTDDSLIREAPAIVGCDTPSARALAGDAGEKASRAI